MFVEVACLSLSFVLQDSRGNPHVRAEVAKFIEDRDGVGPSDPNVSAQAHHSCVRVSFAWRMLQPPITFLSVWVILPSMTQHCRLTLQRLQHMINDLQ